MNKTCKSCLKVKSADAFYKRASSVDGLQPWCSDCSNKDSSERFKVMIKDPASKDQRYTRNRKAFRANVEWFQSLKNNKPCMDCKVIYPYYKLEYDHRDPSLKKNHVSSLVTQSRKIVLEEIAKCDLVCANCHRERTHNRKRVDARKKFASSKKGHKSLAFLDLADVQEEALLAAAKHAVKVLKKRREDAF